MPGHPSFDTDQAWFLYAAANPRGPGFCRLLLVEAKSRPAVAFLERVSDGGRVSSTVSLMTVHRQCPVIGIRSELVEEIPFDVFANDIVERSRVDRDPLAVQAYREAMSAVQAPTASQAAVGSTYKEALSVLRNVFPEAGEAEAILARLGDVEGREVGEVVAEVLAPGP